MATNKIKKYEVTGTFDISENINERLDEIFDDIDLADFFDPIIFAMDDFIDKYGKWPKSPDVETTESELVLKKYIEDLDNYLREAKKQVVKNIVDYLVEDY